MGPHYLRMYPQLILLHKHKTYISLWFRTDLLQISNLSGLVSDLMPSWSDKCLTHQYPARNLKCYPFSLKMAIKDQQGLLHFLNTIDPPFMIETCDGTSKEFLNCSDWELLNLKVPTVLGLPDQLYATYGISQSFLQSALDPFLVQTLGMESMLSSWKAEAQPRLFVGATRHYSWPKGAGKQHEYLDRPYCSLIPQQLLVLEETMWFQFQWILMPEWIR